jgi:hypothetical protein
LTEEAAPRRRRPTAGRVCLALQVCDVLLGAKVCELKVHRVPP